MVCIPSVITVVFLFYFLSKINGEVFIVTSSLCFHALANKIIRYFLSVCAYSFIIYFYFSIISGCSIAEASNEQKEERNHYYSQSASGEGNEPIFFINVFKIR